MWCAWRSSAAWWLTRSWWWLRWKVGVVLWPATGACTACCGVSGAGFYVKLPQEQRYNGWGACLLSRGWVAHQVSCDPLQHRDWAAAAAAAAAAACHEIVVGQFMGPASVFSVAFWTPPGFAIVSMLVYMLWTT